MSLSSDWLVVPEDFDSLLLTIKYKWTIHVSFTTYIKEEKSTYIDIQYIQYILYRERYIIYTYTVYYIIIIDEVTSKISGLIKVKIKHFK